LTDSTPAWPCTIIIDEYGVIQFKTIANTTFEELSGVIDELLK
jgi:hypothetical protein